ncbi:MAG: hypothetical protein WD231_00060 [Candidatus Woykebacteria bacterium]
MLSKIFGSPTKFESLRNILSNHEQTSTQNLHETHPNVKNILERHNIDLAAIRRRGVRVATAAAVLGAFLSIPFLIGHPKYEQLPNQAQEQSHTAKIPDRQDLGVASSSQIPGRQAAHASTSTTHHKQQNENVDPSPHLSGSGSDNEVSKFHGHMYGRSYMAPPKEHGYHDLGLHRGEDRSQGKAESPGPHPEELGVNHSEGGNQT